MGRDNKTNNKNELQKIKDLNDKRGNAETMLKHIFKKLRADGIRACINITQDFNTFHEATKNAKVRKCKGSCCTEKAWFGRCTMMSINRDNNIYIDFCSTDKNTTAVVVGRKIARKLDLFKINYEWDGTTASCIKVIP
jgi:hypothetical protein